MIPHPTAIDRVERECACRETERSTYWQTGKFSLPGLQLTQELIAKLPNTRSEALAALAKHGDGADVSPDMLRLTAIGWLDTSLAQLSGERRQAIVVQAIARLEDIADPQLLASARLVAESLPDYRSHYEQRLAPIVAWATKHHDEITEEEHV